MFLKKIGIVLFLILFLLPVVKIYGITSDAGFIPENIWYSKDPFEEGDKIKIYTLIFNPDSRELSGTVMFFDKTIFLGKKSFAVPPKGVKDISIDWTAIAGDHTIFGKIENARFLISKDNYEEVYLAKDETEKSKRTVAKKIIPKESLEPESNIFNADNITKENTEQNSQIENIKKTIQEKTPDFIAKPISMAANAMENFRENIATTTDEKKEEVKIEIKNLDKNINIILEKVTEPEKKSSITKPLKYVELFLLSFASFVFNNKIIFYGILIVIIFLTLRFIWKKFF